MLKNKTIHVFLIITIFGFLVYSNGLSNDFVGDDESQITRNLAIRSVSNIPAFFLGGTFYSGGEQLIGVYYKPIMVSVFSVIYAVSGENSYAYHLIQLVLHIINSCLLYIFFRRHFAVLLSSLLAIAFLIHPANSESLLYISGMQETLFFLFGMIGFLIITRQRSKKLYMVASVSLLLSLLSKETGILFIAISFLYILLFAKKNIRKLTPYLLGPVIVYILMRVNALGPNVVSHSAQISKLSLAERLINMPPIIMFYFKQFIVPVELAYVYRWAYTEITFEHFTLPLALVSVIGMLLVVYMLRLKKSASKYFKTYVFFILLLYAGLFFHAQIIPLDFTVSERWLYVPIVGMLGIVGVFIAHHRVDLTRTISMIIVAIILFLFAVRTTQRSYDWRNQLVLSLKDSTVLAHQDYTGQDYLANDLLKQGKLHEALEYSKQSVDMFPYFTNLNTMGIIYINLGEYEKAHEALMAGLEYGKYDALYKNLGNLSILYGEPNDYLEVLEQGVEIFPNDAKLWMLLAVAQYRSGYTHEALGSISKAKGIQPDESIEYVYNTIVSNKELHMQVNTMPE